MVEASKTSSITKLEFIKVKAKTLNKKISINKDFNFFNIFFLFFAIIKHKGLIVLCLIKYITRLKNIFEKTL